MIWKWLGALLLFPVQMVYLMVKAAVCLVLPPKLRDLSQENVLVTGGGRGIGRHLAREFARRGARKIILWGRTEKCLKETTEEIRMMGTECHYFICDVGNREEVYRQAKAVREKVGDITILVNNAAVVHGKSLMDSDDDALLKSQHINTLGQFWVRQSLVSHVVKAGKESDGLQPVGLSKGCLRKPVCLKNKRKSNVRGNGQKEEIKNKYNLFSITQYLMLFIPIL